jgi:streptomycin 6-kinase
VKHSITVPDEVRRRALAAGAAGEAWLAGLAGTVAELAQAWGLTVGRTLRGGTEAYVAEVTLANRRAAVLKVLPPEAALATGELQVLLAAGGRGYAEVYAHDESRAAILLERLGQPLASLGLPADAQLAIICETLGEAWALPPEGARLTTGAEKARSLGDFITATWLQLGKPCSAEVIETALRFAEARFHSFDPRSAVLAHGDAHPWNTLLVPGDGPPRFKLIDPDGLLIEPAYDLAIPMREWTAELLAGDPLALGVGRCRRLAELTGVDPEPIWQWGFIERTSTGLLCMQLGLEGGPDMLAVAEEWARGPAGDGALFSSPR